MTRHRVHLYSQEKNQHASGWFKGFSWCVTPKQCIHVVSRECSEILVSLKDSGRSRFMKGEQDRGTIDSTVHFDLKPRHRTECSSVVLLIWSNTWLHLLQLPCTYPEANSQNQKEIDYQNNNIHSYQGCSVLGRRRRRGHVGPLADSHKVHSVPAVIMRTVIKYLGSGIFSFRILTEEPSTCICVLHFSLKCGMLSSIIHFKCIRSHPVCQGVPFAPSHFCWRFFSFLFFFTA